MRRVKPFSAFAAFLGWIALVLQFYLAMKFSLGNGEGFLAGLISYFSFFTILTNLLVALALTAPAIGERWNLFAFFRRPGVNTTIAASIVVVGLTYFFLLRRVWDPRGLQLVVDGLLHYVMPVLFLVYWAVGVPKHDLDWRRVPRWMVYPAGYFAYAMVRGAISGVYPYHFIDAAAVGYTRAFANGLGILTGFGAIAVLLVVLARRVPRRQSAQ